MAMDTAPSRTAGWFALLVAFVVILGVTFLILKMAVDLSFGRLVDICHAVAAAVSAGLASALYGQHEKRHPQVALPALYAVIAGTLFAVVGSVLIIHEGMGFFLAGTYTMTGYALIGLWLIGLNRAAPWPRGLGTLGRIAGIIMALGLASVPSIILGIDSVEEATWHTWIGQAGFVGWAFLYPAWCVWFWRIRSEA